jgi:hypothetical protein
MMQLTFTERRKPSSARMVAAMRDVSRVASGVDWSCYSDVPELIVHCRCGGAFRSHTRLLEQDIGFLEVSRKPCPDCGSHSDLQALAAAS